MMRSSDLYGPEKQEKISRKQILCGFVIAKEITLYILL